MAENKGKTIIANPFLIDERSRTSKKEDITEVAVEVGEDGKKVYKKVKHKTPETEVFKTYRNLSEISVEIAKEIVDDYVYKDADISKLSYREIRDKGLTFFMSSSTGFERTGLLSLCPALSTAIRLYKTMPESNENKADLLSKIKKGIEAVFKFIYRDGDWRKKDHNLKPVFDASPYASTAFYAGDDEDGLEGRSYIDSISWAVTLFFDIMYFTEKDKKYVFEEYRVEAKKLIKWCISYVNKCVLTIKAEDIEDGEKKTYDRPVGWSFTKVVSSSKTAEAQKSLYFTYAVASIYYTIFSAYRKIIDNLMSINRANDNETISLKSLDYYNNDFKLADDAIAAYKERLKEKFGEEEAENNETLLYLQDAVTVLKNEDKEKLKDYYFFNDDKSAEYNGKIYSVAEINEKLLGSVSQLKWNLEKISTDLWEKAKKDDRLENNFVYDDFSLNIATPESVQSGGQTNALFAGLLQITICLYSAYDFVVSYTEDDGTERFGLKAYQDMQNIMLLHVQRVQRFYDKLAEKGKAFGVDSLILRFSEDFSDEAVKEGILTDRELAEQLRKQSILIASLTPMLLKTNNLISNTIIRYPQKQMGESLVRIGEKRFYDRNKKTKNENEKYRWFWEADGYHAMSNYYYVGAIYDFYTYYRNYEEEYISRYKNLRETLLKDLDYTDSVRDYYQAITGEIQRLEKEHEEELAAKDIKIAEAEARANQGDTGSELVTDINKVVRGSPYFDDPEFFRRIIKGMRRRLAEELVERYSKNPLENKDILEKLSEPLPPKDDAFFSLIQAFAADIILPSAIEAKSGSNGRVKDVGRDGLEGEGIMAADLAFRGGKQLIKDGLINDTFVEMCSSLQWNFQKK
ncbi:MAG: hypothetical protein LBI04_11045 [Treponema sp.]|jgi:hypothetical protein|nr:hypothetical protein [Treponema sp.]